MVYRSFNQVLTLDYLDSPRVNIYMHNNAKDVFYELTNLEDIRDRSVLKVFEADSSGRGPGGLGPNGLPPVTNADEFLGGVPASQSRGHTRRDTMPHIKGPFRLLHVSNNITAVSPAVTCHDRPVVPLSFKLCRQGAHRHQRAPHDLPA